MQHPSAIPITILAKIHLIKLITTDSHIWLICRKRLLQGLQNKGLIKIEVGSKINTIMAFGKCDKCEQSVKVKKSGKRYILPLFFLFSGLLILAYEHDLNNSGIGLMILGSVTAASGVIWLVVIGVRYFRS